MVRPVDVQTSTAQTPGVERSHQTRPQQAETEQRVQQGIAQEAQDRKMQETQQAADPKSTEMRLHTEGERRRGRRRHRREEEPAPPPPETPPERGRDPNTGHNIDITI